MEADFVFPALFVGHGSISNAFIKDGKYYKALMNFKASNPIPDTIVVLSAHWQTDNQFEITCWENNEAFCDDEESNDHGTLKRIKPITGNVSLARSIVYTLKKKGIKSSINDERGIDQGVWIPLSILYPDQDIPIVQISLQVAKGPRSLFKLGMYLKKFRTENILFMGSGNVVYNRKIRHQEKDAPVSGWAKDFDSWIEESIFGDLENLFNYQEYAPNADYAVPTTEHLDPLFFVLGLKNEDEKIKTIYEGFEHSTTSMRTFIISK